MRDIYMREIYLRVDLPWSLKKMMRERGNPAVPPSLEGSILSRKPPVRDPKKEE